MEYAAVIKENTILAAVLICLYAISACGGREISPDKPEGVYRIELRPSENEKEIYIGIWEYEGSPGPHGWVGWKYFSYSIVVPMESIGHFVNPVIHGGNSLETYGYVNFDRQEQKIFVHMWEVVFDEPANLKNSYGHESGTRHRMVNEVREMRLNGEYKINDNVVGDVWPPGK